MKLCGVVPTHNHWRQIGAVVERLRAEGMPVIVVDDGSAEPAAAAIAALHNPDAGVTVHRLLTNQGKGAAVRKGLEIAWRAGFSHAVQVDADGQHDLDALPTLLALATAQPEALISGRPVYDASIPIARKIGRWVTHIWVWIETCSLTITDSMCGFRVYPLSSTQSLFASESVGRGMDFDTEVMVRLYWRGTPVVMTPVNVTYPPGNTSNFQPLRDNWRISAMHTRLVFSGIRRALLPTRKSRHWSGLGERGAYWGLRFCIAARRFLGRSGCLTALAPVVLYFYVSSGEQRRSSRQFLSRALGREATWFDGLRHFMGFAARSVDSFAAWSGDIPPDAVQATDPAALAAFAKDPRGALIVVAHLGNLDLARALLSEQDRARLTVLVHTRHAANFNKALREVRPEAAVNVLEVTDIGPDTAIDLKQRVERGEWVVIAGDRTPVLSRGRVSHAPFFGADAPFSHGPWVLAALLDCPVYVLTCLKDGERWRLTVDPFADRIVLPRGKREAALQEYAVAYAEILEAHVRRDPFQWYNFFDFWTG